MENKKEQALNSFLDTQNDQNLASSDEKEAKKQILNQRDGIVERVDKIFVTKDGKQLLREQY